MTADDRSSPKSESPEKASPAQDEKPAAVPPQRRELMPLPGLAGISLYMLVLAGIGIVGVAGGHVPPVYLVFSAAFVTAGLGLLLLLRWAWALTLAAVMLLTGLFLWRFTFQHALAYIVQGLLNLVFFLYLIRTEVREKLR